MVIKNQQISSYPAFSFLKWSIFSFHSLFAARWISQGIQNCSGLCRSCSTLFCSSCLEALLFAVRQIIVAICFSMFLPSLFANLLLKIWTSRTQLNQRPRLLKWFCWDQKENQMRQSCFILCWCKIDGYFLSSIILLILHLTNYTVH